MNDKADDKSQAGKTPEAAIQFISANQIQDDMYHLSVLCGMVKLACSPGRVLLEKTIDKITAFSGDAV